MPCPFCQPNVLKTTFAESENFRAIYNLAPILPGHVLIVPKQHVCRFLDLDEKFNIEMVVFSRKIIKVLMEAFKCNSFDWTIQEGSAAGQTIEHMHLHIIPRNNNDLPEPGEWYPAIIEKNPQLIDSFSRPKITDEKMEIIVHRLKEIFRKF